MLNFIADLYDPDARTELEDTGDLQNIRKMQKMPEQGTQIITEGQELDEEEAEEEEETQVSYREFQSIIHRLTTPP